MRIKIYHASAGYGHQKVAEVLKDAFESRKDVQLDVELEDALDKTPFLFKWLYPATYFQCVKWFPWAWGFFYDFFDHHWVRGWVRPLRSLFNFLHGQRLLKEVRENPPDAILCTHFFTAELFATAKRKGDITPLLITVVTDFFPHTFWINSGTDAYWVMHADSCPAILSQGIEPQQVVPGGIPVDPQFKRTGKGPEFLESVGFDKERLTLLITSGSFGLGPYAELLRELETWKDRVQCFIVCGHNESIRSSLEAKSYPFPVKIFGFVNFMDELMEASDLLVAKPGGATTVESLAKEIPMIMLKPIPGQEARNTQFLREQGAAYYLDNPKNIRAILEQVMNEKGSLEGIQNKVKEIAKPDSANDCVEFVLEKLK